MNENPFQEFFDFFNELKQNINNTSFCLPKKDILDLLTTKLSTLVQEINKNQMESELLLQISQKISEGLLPNEVLEYIFQTFRSIIPYNRIGIALLDESKENLTSFWVKSDSKNIQITKGYSAKIQGSSLQSILETGKPRIINDLEKYLIEHPHSESTALIVKEGMRSNLTCPLIAVHKPIGFIFFTSILSNTYKSAHIEIFLKIAALVSSIIEKSWLYERLQELSEFKTKFIGIVAHDLRNPLQVIKGNIEFQEMLGEIPPKQKETLETIKRQTEKMMDLIKTFLGFSVIESGHLLLNKTKQSFHEFLEKSVNDLQWLCKGKNITIDVQDDTLDLVFSFDTVRIDQVLNNLISNSVKFSPPNTLIKIEAKKEANYVAVSVSDQGPGIPQNEIENLFHFFSTTSIKPIQKESTTGLGLAICQKIVEAHEGKIGVKNNPDKGATFTFYLPLV